MHQSMQQQHGVAADHYYQYYGDGFGYPTPEYGYANNGYNNHNGVGGGSGGRGKSQYGYSSGYSGGPRSSHRGKGRGRGKGTTSSSQSSGSAQSPQADGGAVASSGFKLSATAVSFKNSQTPENVVINSELASVRTKEIMSVSKLDHVTDVKVCTGNNRYVLLTLGKFGGIE
jgi:hypothetical protein